MQHGESPDHAPPRASRPLAWAAAIGLMVGLTALFQAFGSKPGGIVGSVGEGGRAQVILQRDRSGHFLAEGAINGIPVVFLVDTGATDVAISERTARRMGLEFGPRATVMTAAGPSPAWRTRLDRVSLGGLERTNVRATITPGLGNEALLGMSFLQYYPFRQEGDRLIIGHGLQESSDSS